MTSIIEPTKGHNEKWQDIEWDYHERYVRRMQERIFRATQQQDWKGLVVGKERREPCAVVRREKL